MSLALDFPSLSSEASTFAWALLMITTEIEDETQLGLEIINSLNFAGKDSNVTNQEILSELCIALDVIAILG